jgi:hypothetical protein
MQLVDGELLLSASDLINFLECEHLTALDLDKAHGRLDAEAKRPDTAELVAAKGDEHELRHLDQMREIHGDALVEIEIGKTREELVRAAEETEVACTGSRSSSSRIWIISQSPSWTPSPANS